MIPSFLNKRGENQMNDQKRADPKPPVFREEPPRSFSPKSVRFAEAAEHVDNLEQQVEMHRQEIADLKAKLSAMEARWQDVCAENDKLQQQRDIATTQTAILSTRFTAATEIMMKGLKELSRAQSDNHIPLPATKEEYVSAMAESELAVEEALGLAKAESKAEAESK